MVILAMNYLISYSQSSGVALNKNEAVNLVYNYPANQPVKYLTEGKMIQTMDIMGQSMQVNVNSVFGCTVKRIAGDMDKNLKLEIMVDTLGQTTESPMGTSGGSINDVQGKVLNIVITPQGKSVDISEAGQIVYNIEGSGESNLSETFSNFFPILPQNAVKTGDSWNSTDSIDSKTTAMSMRMIINSENKMEGTEMVGGIECVKISSVLQGTRTMDVNSQGMDLSISGPFTGTSECFFSLKDGYFIKQVTKSKLTGNIDMRAPESMSFPIVMEISSVNEVK